MARNNTVTLNLNRRFVIPSTIAFALIAVIGWSTSDLPAQVKSKSKSKSKSALRVTASPAEVKQLELRKQRAHEEFVRSTAELARDFEQAGLLEESKKLLQTIQRLDSKVPGVQEKIKQIEETILSDRPVDFSLDVTKGWGDPIARVRKGKPFRIKSEGKYKLQITAVVDPTGIPDTDPLQGGELAPGVRVGALMALVIPVDAKGKPGKPGKPIQVGTGRQITPPENGLLFLAVNVPKGHRSTGKLNVQLSGYIAPPK